ncbi:NAD metabolism ATPase/kinase [Pseudalgibacter alginicilyticus]|uniref:NAD metabolism ATPase/kinase n=1 Tax=Pseudalgibacter alginicilyticus TaxID=1736674 RepID=A0A0P0D6N8_9FLAO|nr:DUF4301 family protein [Pseudalgibacter alginicilyticus]ALJ05796.1 NAD metabolism ATPase/kinase [Pseudalgibacter alginicilyticus]
MFSDKDIQQITNKGITVDQVNAQVLRLKNGMSYSNLIAAATIGKGIESYDENDIENFIKLYEDRNEKLSIIKFVPASGAATRMFKFLFQFIKNYNPLKESIESYSERKSDELIKTFVANLENFPFYNEVILKVKQIHPNYDTFTEGEKHLQFVKAMLDTNGLNYSFLPKGLLPFHKYGNTAITAFQEHLFESSLYGTSNGIAHLHFTVSEAHHDYFINEFNKIKNDLEQKTNTTFKVSFSFQKEATETVALTKEGRVFRNEDDSILFRPAGHGALLENLNDLDGDIIFIKNIDNIVVSEKNIAVSNYKKLLAGILLEAQEKAFSYLHKLDKPNLSETDFNIIALFLRYRLNVPINPDFEDYSLEEKSIYLKDKLNRPIRVCGMVKNEGEPGGGPFWVKDNKGKISLQIVEFAQINFGKKGQQSLVYKATHFNPTDLVCGVKNYKGEKFDLKKFVDPEAAFITMKTQNGVDIKALELPGLWNGSMAHWNSIFVEVPLETFNPVKTVNDLLKPAHQVL